MSDQIPEMLYRLYYGGASAVGAVLLLVCSILITHKRTYYPLLRRIFQVFSAVLGGNAAAQYFDPVPNPLYRLLTITVVVVLASGCVVFAYRRNRVPQWVTLDIQRLRGHEAIDYDNLDNSVLTSLSLLRHGAASEELASEFRDALRQWEAKQAGTARLRAQLAERRAARGRP